jgi:hypothetical protein
MAPRRLVALACVLAWHALAVTPDLGAQRQTANEQQLQKALRARNGIVVGSPKVYDDSLLQQMLLDAEARLAALQMIDQASVAGRVGSLTGARQDASTLGLAIQGPRLPQVVSTAKGATSGTVEERTGNVDAQGQASSESVLKTTTGQPSTDIVTTTAAGSPPTLTTAQPSGAFPTSFSVSSSDVLNEQMQLTFEIANLRLLLEGALSDRVTSDERERRLKPRVTIGIPVTIDADARFKNAVAVVELEVDNSTTGCPTPAKDRTGEKPREKPSLTAVLPREKTYNVAEIRESNQSFGLGMVTQILGTSSSWWHGRKAYYVVQDQDTVGLSFQPNRADSIGVAWQFRPVLGREAVRSGTKQVFVQVAFDSLFGQRCDGHAVARTYWRKFDRKRGIVGDIVGQSLNEEVVNAPIRRLPLQITPGGFTAENVVDVGDGRMLLTIPGPFLAGTSVRIGSTVMRPGHPNAAFEPSGIQIVASIAELALNGVKIVARDGNEVPLQIGRFGLPEEKNVGLPLQIDKVVVTGLDENRSILAVTFKQLDELRPLPILVVGGRVFGYADAPLQRSTNSLTAIVPTSLVASNPEVLATALFAPEWYQARGRAAGSSLLAQPDRLVVMEERADATRFLLYGSRLDSALVLVPADVKLETIGQKSDWDTLRVVTLRAEQLRQHKQLVLQRENERPSFVAIPGAAPAGGKAAPSVKLRQPIAAGADEAEFVGEGLESLERVACRGRALDFYLGAGAKSVVVSGLRQAGLTSNTSRQQLEFYFRSQPSFCALEFAPGK